jgi:hypothetical protein
MSSTMTRNLDDMILDVSADCPHQPGEDPSWQESSLFVWHDLDLGVAGFWRLGQEPVVGALNSCFGMFTADGLRFRSNVTGVPMAATDRGETFMGWGNELRADLDTLRIKADFPDCEAQLQFTDYFPRYDYIKMVSGDAMPEGTAHHIEVAGRMTGKVRIGERELEINALGYRDRSWGPRDWGFLRGTRWWPCVFGPDLAVHTLVALTYNGKLMKVGYVFRDGVPIPIRDVEVLVELESDALSPRGGRARIILADGEHLDLACEVTDGIILHVRGYTAVEGIGTAQLGIRRGMSNLEVSTNAGGGTSAPVLALGANMGDGLSRR